MKQLDLFDVYGDLNNLKSKEKILSEDVNCEFYKQGKCHAIETKEEPCIHCWLCQK
jgi:hypothetical protein